MDGIGRGIGGAVFGGYTGGVISGVAGGIRANKMGLNFWSGDGVLETPFDDFLMAFGKKIDYSNESFQDFIDKNEELYKLSRNVDEIFADGSYPQVKGYSSKGGYLYNPKGNRINGATSLSRKGNKMIIRTYISKSAFRSSAQLYMTAYHEFMHATFYTFQFSFSSTEQHKIINNWHYDQLKVWGKLPSRLFNNPYNSYSKYFIPKNPRHYFFYGFKTIKTVP